MGHLFFVKCSTKESEGGWMNPFHLGMIFFFSQIGSLEGCCRGIRHKTSKPEKKWPRELPSMTMPLLYWEDIMIQSSTRFKAASQRKP